jgi:hypothetical protein
MTRLAGYWVMPRWSLLEYSLLTCTLGLEVSFFSGFHLLVLLAHDYESSQMYEKKEDGW